MFPIPIISTYGNAIVQEKVKKIFNGDQNLYVLFKSGNLYALGQNNYGQWGTGTAAGTAINSWTLISNNVLNAYDGLNSTVIQKTDGTWWYSGYNRVIGTSTGTDAVLTWTQFSAFDYFSTNNLTPTDIQVSGSSIYVLCSNASLYTMGYNAWGQIARGQTLMYSSFGRAVGGTNIVKFIANPISSWVLKTDGTFARAGNGTMMGNNGSNINDQYTTISTLYTGTQTLHLSIRSLMLIRGPDQTLYGTGSQLYGQLSRPASSTVQYNFVTTGSGLPSDLGSNYDLNDFSYDYTTQHRFIYGANVYATGRNESGQLGVGSTTDVATFTPMVLPVPVQDIIDIKGTTLATYMLCKGNKFYGCGSFNYLPGYSTNQSTMQEISLPE